MFVSCLAINVGLFITNGSQGMSLYKYSMSFLTVHTANDNQLGKAHKIFGWRFISFFGFEFFLFGEFLIQSKLFKSTVRYNSKLLFLSALLHDHGTT